MKKSWIIIIIITGIVAADLLMRQMDEPPPAPDRESAEEAAPPMQTPEITEQAPQKQAAAPQDAQADAPAANANEPDAAPAEAQSFPIGDCIGFGQELIGKDPAALKAEDVRFLTRIAGHNRQESIVGDVNDYLNCQALAKQNVRICAKIKNLLPKLPRPADCQTVFKVMIPIRSHFVRAMKPEQFDDLYTDLPPEMHAWMKELLTVLNERKPDDCKRLADDPFVMTLCRMAAGDLDKPSSDRPLELEIWKMIMTLKTGQRNYMPKNENSFSHALLGAALEEKNACESFFLTNIKTHCAAVPTP